MPILSVLGKCEWSISSRQMSNVLEFRSSPRVAGSLIRKQNYVLTYILISFLRMFKSMDGMSS